ESLPLYNPATAEVIGAVPLSDASDVDRAVQAAAAVYEEWRDTSVFHRARIMIKYKELLEQHQEELARLITEEHGKTLDEARAEPWTWRCTGSRWACASALRRTISPA